MNAPYVLPSPSKVTTGVSVELLNMTNRGGWNSGRLLLVSFRRRPETVEECGVFLSDTTGKQGRRFLNSPL